MKASPLLLWTVALAIAGTTAMDYAGFSMFSAFSLLAWIVLYWLIARHRWSAWGLRLGQPGDYGLAVLYPLFVMGLLALLLVLSGADLRSTDWRAAGIGFLTVALATVPGAFITEEGFFRGTLFAACDRDGFSARETVVVSSLVFSAWHISWATLSEEGRVSLHILPIYLTNAALLGAAWGLMRVLSGSVLVASVSHGVWNGMAYSLFGFGENSGVLNIDNPLWLDPERGLVAVLLSGLFVGLLWRRFR